MNTQEFHYLKPKFALNTRPNFTFFKRRIGEFSRQFDLPEVLFISSYPPRECGIATYTQDLIKALKNKYHDSFNLSVCALEAGKSNFTYPEEVKYVLDTNFTDGYLKLANTINADLAVQSIVLQHEFGFFSGKNKLALHQLLFKLNHPISIVFHTVLPNPNADLMEEVNILSSAAKAIIVMTKHAKDVLVKDYDLDQEMIEIIPHGTHLVPHLDKNVLKAKYGFEGKKVLSTFGLLSSGKGIETTLEALPKIIEKNKDVLFLIIGKTHPSVFKTEGQMYRQFLTDKVESLKLQEHVKFINIYLPLPELLEILQLTDVYVFTSKDPNQTVSGTFSYALSCGCPIVSTPIPHAVELLNNDTGIIFDFQNSEQLATAVNKVLSDENLRLLNRTSILQKISPTAWENSAISHAELLQKISWNQNIFVASSHWIKAPAYPLKKIKLNFKLPEINLLHIQKMSTDFGMVQFSQINHPDLTTGYTLDDNARALIAVTMLHQINPSDSQLDLIQLYLDFISFCLQSDGTFLNYVDSDKQFTPQNESVNLDDANGRAIWALGFLLSNYKELPAGIINQAKTVFEKSTDQLINLHSSRGMAFSIKGLHFANHYLKSAAVSVQIELLADRLVQMYLHESEPTWLWFENYITYANSILPEALLCAYQETNKKIYGHIAKESFDFLLTLTIKNGQIKVVSNKYWLQKGEENKYHGEQPIDVAYTILSLKRFFDVFNDESYSDNIRLSFNWFLGSNHLRQIIYNPCTGGCYDGLEESQVNLNQGAESTLSYLMARLAVEQHFNVNRPY